VQRGPHVSERVAKNRSCLPWHALRLGVLGHRPLVAGSVDADGVTRKAVEVGDSPGVGLREDVFWDILGEIEVAKSGGGGRDKGESGRDGRAVALLLSNHINARREEFTLVIH